MKAIAIITAALLSLTACQTQVLPSPDDSYNPEVDPAEFPDNPEVTHLYFQFADGKTYVYEGQTDNGLEHVEIKLLNNTRKVMGITCIVVNEKVWYNENLIKDIQHWYAQDIEGNLLYFGERVSNYKDDGTFRDNHGSWEAGVDGAKPGTMMPANPEVGKPFRVKYLLNVAEDQASVEELGVTHTVPYGSFIECLKVKYWTDLDPGIIRNKFYAPGIGLIGEVNKKYNTEIGLVDIK